MTHDEVTELLPAYVLGALDGDERRLVEQALAADPDVRAQLAEYEASAESLVALAPLRPAPDHLQADLKARLAARREGTPPAPLRVKPRRLRRWWLIAAAALVVVVGVGVIALLLLRDDEPSPDQPGAGNGEALYTELAAQEGALWYDVVPTDLEPGVSGALVAAPDGDRAVIRVEELPAITDENVFQLWLVNAEGQRIDGGLFRQREDGVAYVEIPLDAPLTQYQRFGASLEPAGGSPFPDRPTGPGVFGVPLDG